MGTLSDSDYAKWIEEDTNDDNVISDNEDDIIFSDSDEITRLKKELVQVKKKLQKKQAEVERLRKRNELLTHLVKGKSIRLE